MKLEVTQNGLVIKVETEQDKAYVRDTLKIKSKDESILLMGRFTDFGYPYELYTQNRKEKT